MAVTTIELDGDPWMVCEPENAAEIDEFLAKTNISASRTVQRPATPRESAKLAAEKVLRSMHRENPDGLFGTTL